jgi:hypothetical protein
MRCHRCHGWMVMERYYGPGMPYWGLRCLSCGEILDPVILENRNPVHKPSQVKAPGTSMGNSGRG